MSNNDIFRALTTLETHCYISRENGDDDYSSMPDLRKRIVHKSQSSRYKTGLAVNIFE